MESSELKKDLVKLGLMGELQKLMDRWSEIYKRDRRVTKDNFEEVINGAWEITTRLKKLEPFCNHSVNELDAKLLNWIREKKVQYETLAFDLEVNWKRMSRLNDELLMVRIDNKKSKDCLFIIFESAENKEIAREQMNLFYDLYKKLIAYTDKSGNFYVNHLLNYLEEVKSHFHYPFTYVLIPEGDRKIAEELLRETLGKELNSSKLKEVYFSKEGYLFTDPNHYRETKEKESLYAK